MEMNSEKYIAFCAGVDAAAKMLVELAKKMDADVAALANECAEIGRGGFGYTNAKSKMRALENQYQLMMSTIVNIRSLKEIKTVVAPAPEVVFNPDSILPPTNVVKLHAAVEQPLRPAKPLGLHIQSSKPLSQVQTSKALSETVEVVERAPLIKAEQDFQAESRLNRPKIAIKINRIG